jgi:hypothetical protein
MTSRPLVGALAAGLVAVLTASAATAGPLLGVRGALDDDATLLGRLDPLTLEPRGRALRIDEFHATPVFSPDRRRLAVGLSESTQPGVEPSGRVGLWIVDRAGLEVRRRVMTGIAVEEAAWPTRRRILAYLQGETIAVIDAEAGTVVRRLRLRTRRECCLRPMVGVAGGAAVLTAPRGRPGLALSLIDPDGAMRRVSLGRLRIHSRARLLTSATVAQAGPRRVLASAPNAPLAVVDTRRARRRYAPLPAAPRCPAGPTCRADRELIWLGGERVAMTDYVSARRYGVLHVRARSWLIDLRRRRARPISRHPSLAYGDGVLVAFGRGLTVLGRAGRPRFSALRRHDLWTVQAKAGRIYAVTDGRRPELFVLDAASGRTLHRSRPFRGHLILL